MDARAEQIVLDYLRLLGDAAQEELTPQQRQTFLARSRAAIARQVGETRAEQPHDLERLLRQFGDPQELATAERQRLGGTPPAEPNASPGQATTAQASPDQATAGQASTGETSTGERAGPRHRTRPDRAGRPPAGPGRRRPAPALSGRRPAAAPVLQRPINARWRPGADLPDPPRPDPPVLTTMPRWPVAPRRAGQGPGSGDWPGPRDDPPRTPGLAGSDTPGNWLDGLITLVRRHPLECAAVAVLGVGGLIDPFPLWVLGALAVLVSRLWDTRDKLAAVAVPMVIALLGGLMLAGVTARSASLSGYAHGVHTDGWDLIRAGAVLGAVYLAWRVRQGRRPRRGPPWHQVTRGRGA
ncbi:MAG TPA: hypothetical protein VHY58_07680 [Streptosporangiaceae bacterium]|jgi:hypothetical protein|nr:hypothetical protein [Streptosporangiaceae bacterium]